jgi:CheY-like chemotaxis protein
MRDEILDALLGSPHQVEVPFHSLMPKRVHNLLLVTSLYDCHTFIEDGRLAEMLLSEYMELNLSFLPFIHRVSTAAEALRRIQSDSFDLVISMPRVGDMNLRAFGKAVQEAAPNLPVVLLASNMRELNQLQHLEGCPGIDRTFVWLGDVRLFLAIIKCVEDRANAWPDARLAGVKSILLVEDSVQFYSSYLPMLYSEILKQTEAQTADSPTRLQRSLRKRARPKILLASNFEEAQELYQQYRDDLLGIISDASFPKGGRLDKRAGLAFAAFVKETRPELPIVIQSGSDNSEHAEGLGLEFIDKRSRSLLQDLRTFMQNHLGFGDFIFRMPDGTIVSKANDLRSLGWAIQAIPDESLLFHAQRNHFSTWLRARVEFELADAMRDIPMEGRSISEIKADILHVLNSHRERSSAGIVSEFSPNNFEASNRFVRIGSGSLGGKGRGLAFVNSLLNTYGIDRRFENVRIFVPPTAVLATGVFDKFMETSGLQSFALQETDDEAITRAFLAAELPKEVVDGLWTFLDWVRYPLAVRSSSLLEDASYQPFAGIYETYMIPNNARDPEKRLEELCSAIKMVYASTYHSDAKAYIESTPNRLEEEKMAVVIQQVMGRSHERYHYPDIAGVGRSLNFYPMPGMKPEDGVASIALGLGKTVVDGGRCVRFSPAHPKKPLQSFSTEDYLENAQREFLALDMKQKNTGEDPQIPALDLVSLDLDTAREHQTLGPVGSIYSPDNDAIYDGVGRSGIPLVTMAGVLKGHAFPLAEILSFLLKMGSAASSCPVEIEFAVNLHHGADRPHEFGFLQMRPLVLGNDAQDIHVGGIDPQDTLCISHKTLGNGFLEGVRDVVYVDPRRFERSATQAIAAEVGHLNAYLKEQRRSFLLLGPGRWGSSDPWLGIPVKWSQISAVKCILETDLEDIHVDPSQGSHFFQNIMSFGIGYLTLDRNSDRDRLDFGWLESLPAAQETKHLRLITFEEPLEIVLNGRQNFGAVLKPGKTIHKE